MALFSVNDGSAWKLALVDVENIPWARSILSFWRLKVVVELK